MRGDLVRHLNHYYQSCSTEEPVDDPSAKLRPVNQLVTHFGLHHQVRADGSLDRWHLFLRTFSGKMNSEGNRICFLSDPEAWNPVSQIPEDLGCQGKEFALSLDGRM